MAPKELDDLLRMIKERTARLPNLESKAAEAKDAAGSKEAKDAAGSKEAKDAAGSKEAAASKEATTSQTAEATRADSS